MKAGSSGEIQKKVTKEDGIDTTHDADCSFKPENCEPHVAPAENQKRLIDEEGKSMRQ